MHELNDLYMGAVFAGRCGAIPVRGLAAPSHKIQSKLQTWFAPRLNHHLAGRFGLARIGITRSRCYPRIAIARRVGAISDDATAPRGLKPFFSRRLGCMLPTPDGICSVQLRRG